MPQDSVGLGFKSKDEDRYGEWCQTCVTKTRFYPLDPRVDEIHFNDIARSNCRMDRFNGHHNRDNYKIGQHEVLIAWALMKAGYPPDVCITGLLHDGGEAYLPDLPRPLKRSTYVLTKDNEFRLWGDAENEILKLFPQRFPGFLYPMPAIIKEYDNRMLLAESSPGGVIEREANWISPEGMEPLVDPRELVATWDGPTCEKIFRDTYLRLQLALTGGITAQD